MDTRNRCSVGKGIAMSDREFDYDAEHWRLTFNEMDAQEDIMEVGDEEPTEAVESNVVPVNQHNSESPRNT